MFENCKILLKVYKRVEAERISVRKRWKIVQTARKNGRKDIMSYMSVFTNLKKKVKQNVDHSEVTWNKLLW